VALVSPGRLKVLDDGISMNNCQLGAHYSPTVCPTSYCSEHRAICSAPQSEKSLLRWEGGQLQSKPFERDAWIVAAVRLRRSGSVLRSHAQAGHSGWAPIPIARSESCHPLRRRLSPRGWPKQKCSARRLSLRSMRKSNYRGKSSFSTVSHRS
jgi:hypothetical protein